MSLLDLNNTITLQKPVFLNLQAIVRRQNALMKFEFKFRKLKYGFIN